MAIDKTSNKIGITCIISVLVILGTGITSIPAFAANNPYLGCPDCNDTSSIQNNGTVTVTTDKPVYDHKSIIWITGHVARPYQGQDVVIKILNPSGNVVTTFQASIDNNGDFAKKVNTVGNPWEENGQYMVAVQYGNDQSRITSSVFLQLSGEGPVITPPPHHTPYLNCPDCNSTSNTQSPSSTITPNSTSSVPMKIPTWVKGIFNYYGQGQVSDDDLISAIKFLINQGIIKLN